MRNKKFNVLILSAIFAFSLIPAAFAHKFVLFPDSFDAPVGGQAGVYWTFTEVIGKPEYSRFLTDFVYNSMETPTEARYASGRVDAIPDADFEPYDSASRSVVAPEVSDSDHAAFSVAEAGTVMIHGKFKGQIDPNVIPGVSSWSYAHVKAFINLTNDGMATKRVGGNDYLEAVFAEDVPARGVRVGDTVRFKFYLGGAPLANAPVFAAYDGAPTHTVMENGQPVTVNDYLEAETDGDGVAEFTFDHAAGWFVGAFADEGQDPEYVGGVVFGVGEKGGGSGCDAGFSGLALLMAAAAICPRPKA